MIERTITVKSVDWKDTKDKKRQYLSAILADDSGKENTQSIFDPALQKVVQDAYLAGAPLLITMEKEGQFWNIKTAEITDATKPVVAPHTPSKPQSGRTEKDDDILLAVAFKGAIELEGNLVPGAEPNTKRVLLTTAELLTGLMLLRPKKEMK